MQCDHCGERAAAVHLTQIVDNSVTTKHLCEQCAAQLGIQTTGQVANPLSDFLASMGKGAAEKLPPGEEAGRCQFCGGTLNDFRETGRLGCPRCYESFEGHLRDLLRRLHGSSRHVGDSYAPPGTQFDEKTKAQAMLSELRGQLRRAVEAENFELAAELRDRIRVLE